MINRGDIFIVDFSPVRGSEQADLRPALIIQNNMGNKLSPTTIIATITTTQKPFPFMVKLRAGEGGLLKPSSVNLAQKLTIDKSRLAQKLGSLGNERMRQVDLVIILSLGLFD